MPRLNDLRESVTMELHAEAGIGPSEGPRLHAAHHPAYLDPDADNPVDRFARPLHLRFTAVTIRIGDETRIDIPLNGDTRPSSPCVTTTATCCTSFRRSTSPSRRVVALLASAGTYSHPVYAPSTSPRHLRPHPRQLHLWHLSGPPSGQHRARSPRCRCGRLDHRHAAGGNRSHRGEGRLERPRPEADRRRPLQVRLRRIPSSWADPVDPEQRYQDVAVGSPLTTRPNFKPRVLPPLAASERRC